MTLHPSPNGLILLLHLDAICDTILPEYAVTPHLSTENVLTYGRLKGFLPL